MRTLLALILFAFCSAATAFAAPDPPAAWRGGGPRVRPADAKMAALLRSGLDRSPTLRALVDRIEAGQVIVYLELQRNLKGRLAGSIRWMAATARYRYLRASINPLLAHDQQIAAIAHELQHVVEIIDHPQVDGEDALTDLYRHIGEERRAGAGAWDTARAREVGTLVLRELLATPASKATLSANLTSRGDWHGAPASSVR